MRSDWYGGCPVVRIGCVGIFWMCFQSGMDVTVTVIVIVTVTVTVTVILVAVATIAVVHRHPSALSARQTRRAISATVDASATVSSAARTPSSPFRTPGSSILSIGRSPFCGSG
mmetsp:Transcript_9797/g.20859  ORF Transcript_9797/g.20859 Transcript_9797/m.20859 type:complete len:114 (-) Transcript_9797:400-741(-)